MYDALRGASTVRLRWKQGKRAEAAENPDRARGGHAVFAADHAHPEALGHPVADGSVTALLKPCPGGALIELTLHLRRRFVRLDGAYGFD